MKMIAANKRANFDYDIAEKFLVGIVLTGAEVKSVKNGHVSLKGSFINVHNGEAYLNNAHINPYKFAEQPNYDPTSSRKLLLHKRELTKIAGELASNGISAVPIKIGVERNLIKLEIGLGRGKRGYDKREKIKKRLMEREAQREIKRP